MMLFYFVAGVSDHDQLEPLHITGKPKKIYPRKIDVPANGLRPRVRTRPVRLPNYDSGKVPHAVFDIVRFAPFAIVRQLAGVHRRHDRGLI
jgi:hypothetical protein